MRGGSSSYIRGSWPIPSCGKMEESEMGGVNHCSLHCRLAKFRGSMIVVKYGAAIGRETFFFGMCPVTNSGYGLFKANHSAAFNHDHQTTEFRQTTV